MATNLKPTSETPSRETEGQPQDRQLSPKQSVFGRAARNSDWALLGDSVSVRQLRSQIRRVAPYYRIAFIRGETGSGKQCVARAIHALSPVADGPFLVTNATALPKSVDMAKVLESARGGTLYLTQVGELSVGHQAALIGILRAGDGHRNAELHAEKRDARSKSKSTRVLVASDRDLRTLAAIGNIRQDLYARLSVLEIIVPPLRQRVEDLPNLAEWLLRRLAEERGQSPQLFAESAMVRLQDHSWPNNLRQLERVIRQAAAFAEGAIIEARHLPDLVEAVQPPVSSTLKIERLHDVVQRHVLNVLTRCEGNKVRAAELLGISRSTLYRMLGATPASGPAE